MVQTAHPTPRIRIYSTEWCPYCARAKRLLDARGYAYDTVDLTGDDSARDALVAQTGMRTVPQIFVDGELVGGYTELAQLDAKGTLRERMDARI